MAMIGREKRLVLQAEDDIMSFNYSIHAMREAHQTVSISTASSMSF